jgi:hypothetical protein
MSRSRVSWFAAATVLLAATPAGATTHAVAGGGGGLPGLDVKVDLQGAVVVAGGLRVPIGLDKETGKVVPLQLPAEADVEVEVVAISGGKNVVHVRVPAKDTEAVAWEALLAAGQAEPIFAGMTGYVGGDPGERTGKAIRVVPGNPASYVIVGDIREELTICGQDETLLDPEALYPSLQLHPATVQRLDPEQLAAAQPIVATDHGPRVDAPLAKLLVANGSSVPGSRGLELTDGDPATVWTEQRPGMGQGEFVKMAAPKEVPITRMQIVVSAPAPAKDAAAPKSFYLVTGSETFLVTLPGDGSLKPGQAYEIVFPKPIEASCLTLVLSDAYTRAMAHPVVSVAELVAYSEFDGPSATLDDVAKKLSGERGIAAAQLLERAGDVALPAVEKAYDGLDARGRARAVDVAASHPRCEEAAPLLSRGLCEGGGEAPRKAHEKLERCKGAANVLATRLRQDPASRACIAPTLAAIAGADALEPIADAMAGTGAGETSTRVALRLAFSQALEGAPAGRLAPILGDTHRGAGARLEMLRASGARVSEAIAESDRTVAELLGGSPPMRDRYLVLGPLGELGKAGDRAAVARIAEAISHETEWPVRARAAEVAAGLADAVPALLAAVKDPEPRVREAVLLSIAASAPPGGADVARWALANDGWSFVKVQAIGVLAKTPPSGDVDAALAGALGDTSARVRGATLVALGRRRASAMHGAVRARLDDPNEDPEVRAAAARVLGAMCDGSSADRLTELARGLAVAGTPEDEQQVAVAALEGLAAMHPADLGDRLAPLMAETVPPTARAAAHRALAAHGTCR